jgi:hypothetical protein
MSSLNEHNKPFRFWDWLIIWVCADLGSSGVVTVAGGMLAGGTWLILIAFGAWYIYETHVREQVRKGIR